MKNVAATSAIGPVSITSEYCISKKPLTGQISSLRWKDIVPEMDGYPPWDGQVSSPRWTGILLEMVGCPPWDGWVSLRWMDVYPEMNGYPSSDGRMFFLKWMGVLFEMDGCFLCLAMSFITCWHSDCDKGEVQFLCFLLFATAKVIEITLKWWCI